MNKRLILIMAVGVCSVLHGAAELGVAECENGKNPARLPKFREDVKQGDGGEMRSFTEGELAIWKVRETSVVLPSTQWTTHDAEFMVFRKSMPWYKAWMQQQKVPVNDAEGGVSAVQEEVASGEKLLSSHCFSEAATKKYIRRKMGAYEKSLYQLMDDSTAQKDSASAFSEEYLNSENADSGTCSQNFICSYPYIVDDGFEQLCHMKTSDITRAIAQVKEELVTVQINLVCLSKSTGLRVCKKEKYQNRYLTDDEKKIAATQLEVIELHKKLTNLQNAKAKKTGQSHEFKKWKR